MPNGGMTPQKPAPRTLPVKAPKAAETVGLRVSLIPTEEEEKKDPRKGFKKFVRAVSLVTALLALIAGGLWAQVYFAKREVGRIESQIMQLTSEQTALAKDAKAAKLIQSQLKGASILLDTHRYATSFFTFIEQNTLPEVAFSNVGITDDGNVNLSAEAADYKIMAEQVVLLRSSPLVKSLTLSGISATVEQNQVSRVNFTLAILFDPAVFSRPK